MRSDTYSVCQHTKSGATLSEILLFYIHTFEMVSHQLAEARTQHKEKMSSILQWHIQLIFVWWFMPCRNGLETLCLSLCRSKQVSVCRMAATFVMCTLLLFYHEFNAHAESKLQKYLSIIGRSWMRIQRRSTPWQIVDPLNKICRDINKILVYIRASIACCCGGSSQFESTCQVTSQCIGLTRTAPVALTQTDTGEERMMTKAQQRNCTMIHGRLLIWVYNIRATATEALRQQLSVYVIFLSNRTACRSCAQNSDQPRAINAQHGIMHM